MSTKETIFDPADPRLTAYALGELTDPAERAQVEQLLAASPEARAELADIRTLTAALTAEYEQERLAATAEPPANLVPMPRPAWGPFRTRFPLGAIAALLMLGGLAAFLALPMLTRKSEIARNPDAVFAVTSALSRAQTEGQKAAAELGDPEVRELVVPPGEPMPGVLPPGVTRAVRGPASVSGVAGGNATEGGKALAAAPPVADVVVGRDFQAANVPAPAKPFGLANGTASLDAANPAPPEPSAFTGSLAVTAGRLAITAPVNAKRGMASSSSVSDRRANEISTRAVAPQTAPSLLALNKARTLTAPGSGGAVAERALVVPDMDEPAATTASPAKDYDKEAYRSTPEESRASTKKAACDFNTADYAHSIENAFLAAAENPLSTFSIDVDTASYSIARRFIESGSLPPPDAVRVEEMLNYFPYSDAPPAPGSDKPFAIHLEGAACPWNTAHRLVRIGIKGKEIDTDKRPASNLVFLLDVSGSMMPEERLPLIKQSLHLMVEKLREDDHVAIVVYAGESGLALASTSGDHKDTILHAIDNLHAGGSTNGASGIKLAYQVARKGFIKGGTNRVILATDGDFNVGVTSRGSLLRLIEEERKDGVFLSVLGVGTDNLKDSTMQTLADHGNGNYAYIDRLEEGRKVLVEQMSGTLVTIAKDVKIQVEFNPAMVASYRLVGYEKRMLKKEDFNNDLIDAGEIGAGHSVTALYEIVPVGQLAPGAATAVDALKYRPASAPDLRPTGSEPVRAVAAATTPAMEIGPPAAASHELLTVKMRHKAPDSDKSERSYEEALTDHGAPGEYGNASPDFKFAAAVASFGLVLRDSQYKGSATLGSALELAQEGKGEDPGAHRAGFIELVRRAQALQDVRR